MNSGHYIAVTTAPNGSCSTISDEDVTLEWDTSCLQDESSAAQPYLVTYERCSKDDYDWALCLDKYVVAEAAARAAAIKAGQENPASIAETGSQLNNAEIGEETIVDQDSSGSEEQFQMDLDEAYPDYDPLFDGDDDIIE
jgi:hypothetical protein